MVGWKGFKNEKQISGKIHPATKGKLEAPTTSTNAVQVPHKIITLHVHKWNMLNIVTLFV